MFADDFAYDRSHNVRPRRNIRQVCAMTHIRLLTPHPCLAHRRMVLLSCSQAMQHGARSSRLPYSSDTESHTTPLQTAHFCPQPALFSQRSRCTPSRRVRFRCPKPAPHRRHSCRRIPWTTTHDHPPCVCLCSQRKGAFYGGFDCFPPAGLWLSRTTL